MTPFSDYFSSDASSYARFRPGYPRALFEWLASVAPDRRLAWDCGTGSGQAAVPLADHFAHVIATDPSAAQLAHAFRHAGVHYAAMSAEHGALATGSVSLITVAQALHWFDRSAFYAEARRVLRPDGVVAAWTYGHPSIDEPRADAELQRFYSETVGPYWPKERALVDAGYRTIDFPLSEVAAPSFEMETRWPLSLLLGYVATWSAVSQFRAATGGDPVPAFAEALEPLWGDPQLPRRITWPLAVRVGYITE